MGDLSINLRPSTFLPFQVHYHNVNAPLLAWTKFRILTCKCLTLGAPLLQHLDPPLVLLALLALVALCPLYLLYLLFLSLTLTFK